MTKEEMKECIIDLQKNGLEQKEIVTEMFLKVGTKPGPSNVLHQLIEVLEEFYMTKGRIA